MMKNILLAFALIAGIGSLKAQYVTDYLKAADKYFAAGDYASASAYYEKYLDPAGNPVKGDFNPYAPQRASSKQSTPTAGVLDQARYNLAESYRHLNFPSKAEPLYAKLLINTADYPLARLHHSVMLRALGRNAEAEQGFKAFLAGHKARDVHRQEAERELKNLDFIKAQMQRNDTRYYTLTKASSLNATGASYAPAWHGNNLVFTSTRPMDSLKDQKIYVNRVYEAAFSGGNFNQVVLSSVEQDDDRHQGIVTLSADGNTMYFTRWKEGTKDKDAKIYRSRRMEKGWGDPDKLGDAINMGGSSNRDPFLSSDGRILYFSSNRPGGQGGYDLWFVTLGSDGDFTNPQNLGRAVNSAYDEVAPFYHEASRTLVFSSNGYVGMGGFDFFSSQGSPGNWAVPVNLGHPVNSIRDDIYFTSRGSAKNMLEDVMLSSDRSSACCLDLFYLKKVRPLRQVSGRVISCNPQVPFSGGRVVVIDTVNNKTIYTANIGADGSYSFTMEDHLPLKIDAEGNGFMPKSVHMDLPADMEQVERNWPDICLIPVPKKDETFVIEHVYFDFDKADLRPESYLALDEVVRMLNYYPQMRIELGAHTDSKGSDVYNLRLSDARAKSVMDYLVSKGIAAERLTSHGYGESRPVAPNQNADGTDNPEGRQKNRRTEFKVIEE